MYEPAPPPPAEPPAAPPTRTGLWLLIGTSFFVLPTLALGCLGGVWLLALNSMCTDDGDTDDCSDIAPIIVWPATVVALAIVLLGGAWLAHRFDRSTLRNSLMIVAMIGLAVPWVMALIAIVALS